MKWHLVPLAVIMGLLASVMPASGQGARVDVPAIPAGVDRFALTLEQVRQLSASKNFEVVGHSYLKVPQRTDYAKANGLGAGTSSIAVFDGVAYVAGYSYPPTLFGVLTVDVRDPANMKVLGFIPCNAGTRCPYLRVDRARKLIIFGNDPDPTNPTRPRAGEKPRAGWSFVDASNPRKLREIGFAPVPDGATTHGMEIDGRYLYGCGGIRSGMEREAMQIIDYANPARPREVSTWHVPGMLPGETPGPFDREGADGKPQILQCHEIIYADDTIYTAWRDAGIKIFDVRDRAKPKLLHTFDYTPPFTGGFLGSSHTGLPVITKPGERPALLVTVDENFNCPSGFARLVDMSDMARAEREKREANFQVLSTIRLPHTQDRFDRQTGKFLCPQPISGPFGGYSDSVHLPMMDAQSSGLLHLTWYAEGLRSFDISNPLAPVEIGYYLSPDFTAPGGYQIGPGRKATDRTGRQTREVFQDPDTKLIYISDGNGGGMTVLRYTGSLPPAPAPGGR